MLYCQVGWQGASDFLIRNERLAARGLHTFDFGMDYLEEGSSGKAQMRHYCCHVGSISQLHTGQVLLATAPVARTSLGGL